MSDETKCKRSVADAGGYHFYPCGKPAKWLVNGRPRCGIHAKGHELIRTPISGSPNPIPQETERRKV